MRWHPLLVVAVALLALIPAARQGWLAVFLVGAIVFAVAVGYFAYWLLEVRLGANSAKRSRF
jgi:type IV secretory pathway TrbL component